MLCVTIATGSHKRMLAEQQRLVEDGVKFVELRLDFLRKDPELDRLIPNRLCGTVIACRRPRDGGTWKESEERRITTLRAAIVAGVEYVDLEEDIAHGIPRYGQTRRIISHHAVDAMPDDLEALYARMMACDPDVIKIAALPKTFDDVVRLLRFVRAKNELAQKNPGTANGVNTLGKAARAVRTVGIAMGEMGQITRILGRKFGMPYTYATFSSSRIVAPGLMPYTDLHDAYHYDSIGPSTEVYGVVGHPIGHSLSPLIHNASFREQKMDRIYLPLAIPPKELSCFIDLAPSLDIKGLSVTIPHKVAVIEKLTRLDPAVEDIGACNTVIFDGEQRLGYNTDYIAAVLSIELALGGKGNDVESVLQGLTALVLGAGGAGKALAYGLQKRGAHVIVTDGDGDRAVHLADQLNCKHIDWEARHGARPHILVNCTPIGMHPNINVMPVEKGSLREGLIVFDAVYNPEYTMLIRAAKERGCVTISGVEMFVGQACLQFKLFTGQKASAKLMRDLVKKAISAVK